MHSFLTRLATILLCIVAGGATAQDIENLNIATVTRAPFSMVEDGKDVGFSVDLLDAVAEQLNLEITYLRKDNFADMLSAVQAREVDGAIANISITAERESVMDFTQPIFDSGVQVMMPADQSGTSAVLSAIFTRQIALSILGGVGSVVWWWHVDVAVRAKPSRVFQERCKRGRVPCILVGAEPCRKRWL
jgi:polar amino acid transport system substrate-binding protein